MQIETPRLLLRPMRAEDAPQLYAYASQPQVGPPAGWKPHESLAETQRVMREVFLGKDNVFAIVLRETGELIGSIGLTEDPRRRNQRACMIGYAIAVTRWGMGFATEAAEAALRYAFSETDAEIVTAYTYLFNERSQHVLEACGFTREGVLRRCEKRYDGIVFDCVSYSLLRSEYRI